MRIRNRCPFIAMIILVSWPLGILHAEDGQVDIKREAQEAIHRLAAIQSIVKFIQSDDLLRIPPSLLASDILAHLSEHRSDDGAVAEKLLTEVANRRLGEHVATVSLKVDPKGAMGIRNWLDKQLTSPLPGQAESLQDQASRRVVADLARGGSILRAAYRLAREETANGQVREALSRLVKDTSKIAPSEKAIIQAHLSAEQRAEVERATLTRLLGRKQGDWLSEAEDRLRKTAAKLVDLGLEQYREQVKVLQEAKVACFTPEGIRKELTGAVEKSLAAAPTPPRGVRRYGPFFKHGDTMVSDETARRVGRNVGSVLASMPGQIPEDTARLMLERIQQAPKEHNDPADSLRTFESKMIEEVKGRVAEVYHQRAVQAKQSGDTQERLAGLAGKVLEELVRRNSPCQRRWLALYNPMAAELKGVHSKIRKDLVEKQVGLYCPDLLTDRWRPLEATAQENPPEDISRESLKKLPVWVKPPPAYELLLAETWARLLSKAGDRLRLCWEAMAGQEKSVTAMKPAIEAGIRRSGQWDVVAWRQRYKDEATRNWRAASDRTQAGEAYPDLLVQSTQLLNGIIDEVLGTEVGDEQRELVFRCRPQVQKEVDAQINHSVRPKFGAVLAMYRKTVMANWKRHPLFNRSPGLLRVAEEAMKAAASEIVRPQRQITVTPPPIRPEQPSPVDVPRPSPVLPPISVTQPKVDRSPLISGTRPKVDRSPPWAGTPSSRWESGRHSGETRGSRAPLPGGVGEHPDGSTEPPGQAVGTGGSAAEKQTGHGPHGGTESGGGTGIDGILIPFWLVGIGVPLWLLLTILLSIATVAISRRRRSRELNMIDRNLASLVARCGSARAASALLAQMELAQRMLGEYQTDRPVETLADLRQCSRQLIERVRAGWRHHSEAASLPDLAMEIQQMLVGGVLTFAMFSEVAGANSS